MASETKGISFSINNSTFIENDEDYMISDTDKKRNSNSDTVVNIESIDENIKIQQIQQIEQSEQSEQIEQSEQFEQFEQIEALKKFGSKTLRTQIIKDYVRPYMIKEIQDGFIWRDKWSKFSTIIFSLSEILCIIQTILAFTSASYQFKLLAYLSGIIGILSISFNRIASYAKSASAEKISKINEIFTVLGIKDKLPELIDHDIDDKNKNKNKNKKK